MMQAVLVKDDYTDITPGFPYEIERVFVNTYIKLKNSPRRYMSSSFDIIYKGKKISHKEAYRQYKIQRVKNKLGMK